MDVLLPLLPDGKLTMVMDRTTWHYAQILLNLLVLGSTEFMGKDWCVYLR